VRNIAGGFRPTAESSVVRVLRDFGRGDLVVIPLPDGRGTAGVFVAVLGEDFVAVRAGLCRALLQFAHIELLTNIGIAQFQLCSQILK